jgi:hypothetical protein
MNESALPEGFDYSTLDEQTRESVLRKTDETGHLSPTVEAIKAAKEAETGSLSTEITAQLDTLQRKVAALTQQRDTLSSQVSELQELARAWESERWEGEHEQRVRLARGMHPAHPGGRRKDRRRGESFCGGRGNGGGPCLRKKKSSRSMPGLPLAERHEGAL